MIKGIFETITLTTDPRGVATITLNRPDKHNAMSGEMIEDIATAAAQIDADDTVRVALLRGAGRSFCAGGDLTWMKAQMSADNATRAAEARKLAGMLGALNRLSKPLIACVTGNAFGGGVGLCCVADKVFAVEGAKFGLTETKLGLIPATIGPYVVARMGGGNARQVFMSSQSFDAGEAQRLGIVSTITTAQDIEQAVESEIDAYLNCAPKAVADAKALALTLGGAPDQATIDHSIAALIKRWEHPESGAGIAAFFDKTPPPWA